MVETKSHRKAIAGSLAEQAIAVSGLEQPFGGADWPQKSGYEIRYEITRATKTAILRSWQIPNEQ